MTEIIQEPVQAMDDVSLAPSPNSVPRLWKTVLLPLVIAAVGWTLIYLWFAVPDKWFTNVPTHLYGGGQMSITRGSGFTDGARFIVHATDASGVAVVTIDTPNLNASEYRRIRWHLTSVDPEVTIAVLWRSDSPPERTSTTALEPYSDITYVALPQQPDWSGHIKGIALTIHGTLRQPMFIEYVTIDPVDAREVIRDRLRDWFEFRYWNGLSINTATGGPLEQPVWLPIAAAIVALTAIGWITVGGRKRMSVRSLRIAIALIVAITWLVLDARWLWSRYQQTKATAATFAGKTSREKHVADIDGYLYSFAEQVRARLPLPKVPAAPLRIYIAADDHYFGARLAYHLYPHNAFMNYDSGALPSPERCKPGEYIVVFRRHGVQYDPEKKTLTWDQHTPVPVDILIAHQGNAAFRIR